MAHTVELAPADLAQRIEQRGNPIEDREALADFAERFKAANSAAGQRIVLGTFVGGIIHDALALAAHIPRPPQVGTTPEPAALTAAREEMTALRRMEPGAAVLALLKGAHPQFVRLDALAKVLDLTSDAERRLIDSLLLDEKIERTGESARASVEVMRDKDIAPFPWPGDVS